MNYLNVPLQIKSLNDDGAFSGYGSVWGVTDRQNDVMRRGAFENGEIIKNADGRVIFLWQHDPQKPIATASVREDVYGLQFEGQLVMKDPQAIVAQAHMRAKSVRGVSIGYDTLESNQLPDGRRELTSVRLWEMSLVTFAALPEAQVQTVKSLLACADPREIKNLLRERDGFSRSKATAAAESQWRILQGVNDREDDPAADRDSAVSELAQQLKFFNEAFQRN